MARSKINDPSTDAVTDPGAVLVSLVKGEQIEYPVNIDFIDDPLLYSFEAVTMEADNTAGQTAPPDNVKAGGVSNTLTFRIPTYKGTWSGATAYDRDDLVEYNGYYYEKISGMAGANVTAPDISTYWINVPRGRIYIRIPSTLGTGYTMLPTTDSHVYAFFELAVTEIYGSVNFLQTWKPVRGMIELQFSPTLLV